jgi:hypothetical protein
VVDAFARGMKTPSPKTEKRKKHLFKSSPKKPVVKADAIEITDDANAAVELEQERRRRERAEEARAINLLINQTKGGTDVSPLHDR